MMKYLAYLALGILISVFLTSCQEEVAPQPNSFTYKIIFKNPVGHKKIVYPSGIYGFMNNKCEISWVNTKGEILHYCLDENVKSDTLSITHHLPRIQLSHKVFGSEYFYYFLDGGDTINFSYDEHKLPICEINGDSSTRKNIQRYIAQKYCSSGINPSSIARNGHYYRIYSSKDEITRKGLFRLLKDYINMDSVYMVWEKNVDRVLQDADSLNLSEPNLDFLKKQNYTTYISSPVPHENPYDSAFYVNQPFDPYLLSDRRYFRTIFYNYRFKDSLGISEHWTDRPDLTKFYNHLYLDRLVSTQADLNTLERNLKEYNELYPEDSLFVAEFKKDQGISEVKSVLQLANREGEETTLNEVLESGDHKYYYVDFWASWCAPCRAAMPYQKKLMTALKGKDIGFLFMAYNDKEKNWKEAIEKEGLATFGDHYIIRNSKSADFTRDVKLDRIPRYMIIRRDGKIINANAPSPKDEKTKSVLEELVQR